MKQEQEKDNRIDARILISFAKAEFNEPELALFVLDSILAGHKGFGKKKEWEIAKLIEDRTSYITVEFDDDINVEEGDWGRPVIVGGPSPHGITILDEKKLTILEQDVDDILTNSSVKISRLFERNSGLEWRCIGEKCGRPFGKSLSVDQVKKWLKNFRIGKYMSCRDCSLNNYFVIDDEGGIVFHTLPLDFTVE